jgi:shikimate dehydrogenase
MRTFGLIGRSLEHSFSPSYFAQKFAENQLLDCSYSVFPLRDISEFTELLGSHHTLEGLNVTIPYKEEIIPFLDELHPDAESVGAVNCIKITRLNSRLHLTGYNTDIYGLELSLQRFCRGTIPPTLILGSGGASKAASFIMKKHDVEFKIVSRNPQAPQVSYLDLKHLISDYSLIINCTPLGMYPDVDHCPDLPFEKMGASHFVFDTIYNPANTLLMKRCEERGAKTMNGLEMLHLQADKSWEIWNYNSE